MTVTFFMTDWKQLGRKFQNATTRFSERQIRSAQSAANRAAGEIEKLGRADISGAGNFKTRRWLEGFRAKVSFESRSDINIRITHDVSYWRVFEFGATIKGKPLLWIPLPFAKDAQGVSARDYPQPLFRVDRKVGAPLLLAGNGKTATPKYFGKEQVKIPKKFHLRTIVARVSRNMRAYYNEAMKNGR